jgi:hypothetical protein
VNDATVRRCAGSFGVAGFAVFLIALPLYYLAGPEPRIEDTAATSAFVTRASTFIPTRATLADPLAVMSNQVVHSESLGKNGRYHTFRSVQEEAPSESPS